MVCDDRILTISTGIPVLNIINILGAMQTATSSMIVGFYYLNFGPLIWKNGVAEFKERHKAAMVARGVRNAAKAGLAQTRKKALGLHDVVRGAADEAKYEGDLPKWLMFILSFVFLLRSGA